MNDKKRGRRRRKSSDSRDNMKHEEGGKSEPTTKDQMIELNTPLGVSSGEDDDDGRSWSGEGENEAQDV